MIDELVEIFLGLHPNRESCEELKVLMFKFGIGLGNKTWQTVMRQYLEHKVAEIEEFQGI